ncbi:MAG: helix-hairpin-helix domain-containing protein [Aggregatilineales bacterium]
MIGRLIVFFFGVFFGFVLGQLKTPPRLEAEQTMLPKQQSDPLTEINGIGPAFEQALNAIGVFTFAQLAQQDPNDLANRLGVRVTAERIRREGWIEQARARLAR